MLRLLNNFLYFLSALAGHHHPNAMGQDLLGQINYSFWHLLRSGIDERRYGVGFRFRHYFNYFKRDLILLHLRVILYHVD